MGAKQAVVLCGGFGTRLRPLTLTKPKPLLPVANKPLLDWIIDSLASQGVEEIILTVNYGADAVEEHVKERADVSVRAVREDRPLSSGGSMKNAEKYIEGRFFAMNGDIISRLNFREVEKRHEAAGRIITVTLTEVTDVSRFGVAEVDGDRIVRFVEKPRPDEAPSNLINAGMYVCEPDLLDYLELRKMKIEVEVFPQLAARGEMTAYIYRGPWVDCGALEDYLRANYLALELSMPPTPYIHGVEIIPPVALGEGVKIDPGSVIGPHVCIGDGVSIGRGCVISGSVIMSHATLGERVSMSRAVVGEHVALGNDVKVGDYAVVGDWVEVSSGVSIGRGAKVFFGKEVASDVRDGELVI